MVYGFDCFNRCIVFNYETGVTMKMTAEEKKRQQDGIVIMKLMKDETSVIQKPIAPSNAANVPPNVSADILRIVSRDKRHEVYGSLAMESKTFAQRSPNDIDMVVTDPRLTANRISGAMRGKGHDVRVESDPTFNSHVVQKRKGAEWIDAADIHPVSEHSQKFEVFGKSIPPKKVNGVNVQVAYDQLLRKGNSVMAYDPKTGFGPKPAREKKDVADFVTTSRLLIDSKELQAEAELAKVKKARQALKSWEKHANKIGATGVKKDPIPEIQEQKFIKHATKNPGVDTETLTFRNKASFNRGKQNQTQQFDPLQKWLNS